MTRLSGGNRVSPIVYPLSSYINVAVDNVQVVPKVIAQDAVEHSKALLVLNLPRIAGFTVGTLSLAAVLAISLIAPEGQHLTGTFSVIYAYLSEASKTLTAFAFIYVSSSIGATFAGDWLVLLFVW